MVLYLFFFLPLPLFFLSGAWVSADAATLLTVFEDLGLLRSLLALEATPLDVLSFFLAIVIVPFS